MSDETNGAPSAISPQPIPTIWGFDHTADGSHVVLIKQTFQGTTVDFISMETIEQVWTALRSQQKRCLQIQATGSDSQIVVPGKVMLGPDGEPLRFVPPSQEVQDAMAAHADAAAENAAVDEMLGREDITIGEVLTQMDEGAGDDGPDETAQEPDSDG